VCFFARPKSAMQPSSLFLKQDLIRIQFGDIKVAVDTPDKRLFDLVKNRFADFRSNEDPDVVVTCEITSDSVFDKHPPGAAYQFPVIITGTLETEMVGFHFRARFQEGNIHIIGPRATYPIDFALTHLWQRNHPHGFILHGAGLLGDGRGWIASGPSGCGKTTLAGLMGEQALCDEYVGVLRQDHKFKIVGLPFWKGRPGSGRLDGIHFLAHGVEYKKARLNRACAWAAIRKQIGWPFNDPSAAQRTLDLAIALVQEVPCFELQFVPDASIRQFLWEAA
jgi:hypothetical protein